MFSDSKGINFENSFSCERGNPKLIDRKYQHIVFAFFMALLMSCLMSFVISVFNVGFVNNIFFIWLKAWSLSFTIAFPAVVIVSPAVRKLVSLTLKQGEN